MQLLHLLLLSRQCGSSFSSFTVVVASCRIIYYFLMNLLCGDYSIEFENLHKSHLLMITEFDDLSKPKLLLNSQNLIFYRLLCFKTSTFTELGDFSKPPSREFGKLQNPNCIKRDFSCSLRS